MQDFNFPWGHSRRFNDYPTYIKNTFGNRVQKISVNVGFSCPNRDGTKGTGGCVYCDNNTFKPGYCEPQKSITEQLAQGIAFFEKKYPEMEYMAYFQSYTNTYANVADLKRMYLEALSHRKIVGLVIGTRPDCLNAEILDMLVEITQGKYLTIELGLESTIDRTLHLINRCHTWEESINAINLCHGKGIKVGAHLILGLPGETEQEILAHAKVISELPIHTLKLHQLQITKNTQLAVQYNKSPEFIKLFSFQEYLNLLIRFIEQVSPNIIIERFVSTAPLDKLIAPRWNRMKNFEIVAQIEKELENKNTWQGRCF